MSNLDAEFAELIDTVGHRRAGILATTAHQIAAENDRIAAQLGLDAATYDKEVYAPAFSVLDEPGACERIGPTAAPLVARLKAMVPAD